MQLLRTVEVGGEVDSLLMESGMLFVGIHMGGAQNADLKTLPGSIRVYNIQAGSEHALQGHLVPLKSPGDRIKPKNPMLHSSPSTVADEAEEELLLYISLKIQLNVYGAANSTKMINLGLPFYTGPSKLPFEPE